MSRLTRRRFLQTSALAATAAAVPSALRAADNPASAANASRPNILFIITDQQNSTALSCAGNTLLKTPAADSLAARGTRFARSYCTYPLCSPARASFFTSRMPHEVGVNDNAKATLPAGVVGMGSLFQEAGYDTVWSGKWHLPMPHPALARNGPAQQIPGFRVLPVSGALPDPNDPAGRGATVDPLATDAAIKYLQGPHDPAKPFLLVLSILNPHDICSVDVGPAALDRYAQHYPTKDLPPLPANHADAAIPGTRRRAKAALTDAWNDHQWRQYRGVYYRLVETADALIARTLAALDKAGLVKNTLVVFTSDHGEMMGAHKLTHKMHLYDESVAVPLIVTPPAAAGSRVDTDHLVTGLDILPTLCDYAGIAIPASLEGRSLRPLVEGRATPWRDAVVAESGANHDARMLCTRKYKYIVHARGEVPEELYDLAADPGESKNLSASPDAATQDILTAHRRQLREHLQRTKDPFVMPKLPA